MNIAFNERLSLQPELLFNSAGARVESKQSDGSYSFEGTDKLSYLSLPLSLQCSFGTFRRFNIHAGPQFSFLLGGTEDYSITMTEYGVTTKESYEDDIKEYMNTFELGLNLGAGYSFGKLGISARYSAGVTNISKEAEEDDYKLTNNTYQVSVLYKMFGK